MGFLRMGTTSMVSQFYGADKSACVHILYRSLVIAMVLSAGIALGDVAAPLGFQFAPRERSPRSTGACKHFSIRLHEAPLVLAVLTLNGFFSGIGPTP